MFFLFLYNFVWHISHSKKNWARYDEKMLNYVVLHVEYTLFLSDFDKLEFSLQIFENTQISNFMKIRPVRAKLFHVDWQTDRHNEPNSRFKQFSESA